MTVQQSSLSKRFGHNISRDIGLAQELKRLERMARQLRAQEQRPAEPVVSREVDWRREFEAAKESAIKWERHAAQVERELQEFRRRKLANFSAADIEQELQRRLDSLKK